jgi:regulator of sigma D
MENEIVDDVVLEDVIDDVDLNQVDADDGDVQSGSAEERARLMGWRPKEEYKGNPDDYKEAEDFLTDNDPKSLRVQNRNMERLLTRQAKQLQDVINRQDMLMQQEREKAYKQAEKELLDRHRDAVADGDIDAAEKVLKEREYLAQQKRAQADIDAIKPITDKWIDNNSWFNTDKIMRDTAIKFEKDLADIGVPLEDRLKETADYIKDKFSHKFKTDKTHTPKTPPSNLQQHTDNGRTRQAYQAGDERALNVQGRKALENYMAGFRNLSDKQRETIRSNYLKTSATHNPEFYK